eukprot:347292_1
MGSCCCAKDKDRGLLEQLLNNNKLSIYCVTWNVGGCDPTECESLESLLKQDRSIDPEIYIIGLQEIVELNTSNMIKGDNQKIIQLWRGGIIKSLGTNYRHIECIRLMGILLFIFCKKEIQNEITNITTNTISSGTFGLKNKGAVGIKFTIYETSMCIICCHLASGKENTKKRNENVAKIMQKLTFNESEEKSRNSTSSTSSKSSKSRSRKSKGTPIIDNDIIIFFGDMNYRMEFETFEEVHELILKNKWMKLLEGDQLLIERNNSNVFDGFEEGLINFQPSYKFLPTTNDYDQVKKKKIPAWCDRILYKYNNEKVLKCVTYDIIIDQSISDHKPVFGLFEFEW